MKNYLAIDIGASSGRHILGTVKDGKIVLEEVYRFVNGQVRKNGHDCWDIEKLVESVKDGIDAARAKGPVESTRRASCAATPWRTATRARRGRTRRSSRR